MHSSVSLLECMLYLVYIGRFYVTPCWFGDSYLPR